MSLSAAMEAATAAGVLHWMQGPVLVPACGAMDDIMGTGDRSRVTCPVCIRIMVNDAEIVYTTICVQCCERISSPGTGNPIASTGPWASTDSATACPAGPLPAHQPHPVWLPR